MDFLSFAKLHGAVISHVPPIGKWMRYKTETHMHRRNMAIKFMGDHAFLMDHATMTETVVWRPDKDAQAPLIDHAAIRRAQEQAERERRELQEAAARKAGYVMHQCRSDIHAYLASKGFPEERANIWHDDGIAKLIVPMRVNGRIVGMQQIYQPIDDETGAPEVKDDGRPRFVKKFLYGQRTSGAVFVVDNQGPNILLEGYATMLSVRKALMALKLRYTITVAFSASNMLAVSKDMRPGLVIVDHDTAIPKGQTMPTGQRIAQEIGWPSWMSETPGFDANDEEQSVGLFRFSQALRPLMVEALRAGRR